VKIDKIKIMIHLQTYLIWCIYNNFNVLSRYFLTLYLIFSRSANSITAIIAQKYLGWLLLLIGLGRP